MEGFYFLQCGPPILAKEDSIVVAAKVYVALGTGLEVLDAMVSGGILGIVLQEDR